METTENECLEALRSWAARLGESPTKAQYEDLGLTPAASTVLRVGGGWKEAKRRAGLETVPGRGSRVSETPAHVERNTERSLERRRRQRRWLDRYERRSDGCRDCETDETVCLDSHHVDPEPETTAVNGMGREGYSRDRIREEFEHCVRRCANCHRRVHGFGPRDVSESDSV
jgi:hypothetical protein